MRSSTCLFRTENIVFSSILINLTVQIVRDIIISPAQFFATFVLGTNKVVFAVAIFNDDLLLDKPFLKANENL